MGSSAIPPPQRARSKASDFSELFRSAHGSRHSSRAAAETGTGPSLASGEKPAGTKTASRRSMLPFLGRKKPTEQIAVPPTPMPRKSIGNVTHPATPVNTVRRSFGNGRAVLMITPSNVPPVEPPPLPTKLPSVDAHSSSLGSKLAAHFTPLRSPSRTSKTRSSATPKSTTSVPPIPSPSALSPPALEARVPSIESQRSSTPSRSTTPRPLRGIPQWSAEDDGDEEDFSDLFTLPEPLKKPQQTPSPTSFHIYPEDTAKKSGELTPTTPITPSGQPLQFPIPPSTVGHPRSILADKGFPRYASELSSLSSPQESKSPSKLLSSAVVDSSSARAPRGGFSSRDERRSSRHRSASFSGSDTDISRHTDPNYPPSGFKLAPTKPSSIKPKFPVSSGTKLSSGPPPSVPLPPPPFSPDVGSSGPRSVPGDSPNRVAFPRPRATTLSITSNLVVPTHALPKSSHSSPTRSTRVNSNLAPDLTDDELRETLSQQIRRNAQLQEYIVTITKRHEDDRMAMSRTIEKLERNVRKKMREIEGLRWLVIHNGAPSDIDAAANLARASFSTQDGTMDGDTLDGAAPSSSEIPYQSMSGQKGAGTTVIPMTSSPEIRSDASSSVVSFSTTSISDTTMTPPSLSIIPERIDGITRAERQRLKEERRASKALRRISATSNFAAIPDSLTPPDDPVDPNFDPKQSMDEVLEKLQPFRHS